MIHSSVNFHTHCVFPYTRGGMTRCSTNEKYNQNQSRHVRVIFPALWARARALSQRKIMETVIALGKKKHVLHHENIAYHKTPFREWTLSLNHDGGIDHCTWRTSETKPWVAFSRLIIIHGGGGEVRRLNFNKSLKKIIKNGILTIPDILFLSWTTLPGILFPHKGVLNSCTGYEKDISF